MSVMHNTTIATISAVGVWLVDQAAQMGHLPFWLAFLLAAFLMWKTGRALHRVIRGDP